MLFSVSTEAFSFTSKLIDSQFPDYLRIIPPSAENHALLERSALAQALARLEAVLDPGLLAVPLVGIAWRQGDARVALTLPTQPNAAADTLAAETTGQARVAISLSQFSEILRRARERADLHRRGRR